MSGHSALDFTKAVVSKKRFYNDLLYEWQPDTLTQIVVAKQLSESVSNRYDREYLNRLILEGDRDAEIDSFLTDEGKVIYLLISNPQIHNVDNLFNKLPNKTISYLEDISPSKFVGNLKGFLCLFLFYFLCFTAFERKKL